MDTIEDIKKAVKAFRDSTTFKKLKKRYETDFNLYRLRPYDPGEGYYSYTSNDPRVTVDRGVHMLMQAKLIIKVHEELLTDKVKEVANNVERFTYGILNLNDERLLSIPNNPPLKAQMAWHAVLRGGFALRVFVNKNDDGETLVDIDVWDLYNVAYGYDDDGKPWVAHIYEATRGQIQAEFGKKIYRKKATIIDFWDSTNNAVIIGNEFGKNPEPHGCAGCPAYVVKSGAMPNVYQDNDQYTNIHVGESILAPNRLLHPLHNKTMSDLLTLVRRGVRVPLGVWSPDGDVELEADVWQTERGTATQFETGVEIKPLIEPTMPADAINLVNISSGERQRGGFSHIALGHLGTRLSGYAIGQLRADVEVIIIPFIECLERAYRIIDKEGREQFAEGGYNPVKVRGRTSRGQPFGIPKPVEISPENIEGEWHPEISVELVLPADDAQKYQIARLAREGEIPLLSDETSREMVGVQDPRLEQEKIDLEWTNRLLTVRLFKALEAALFREDYNTALNIIGQLRLMMQQQGGHPEAQRRLTQLESLAMESKGAGTPSGETGMASSVLPSEALGGMPGGAVNAQMPLGEGEL